MFVFTCFEIGKDKGRASGVSTILRKALKSRGAGIAQSV
jgi:hypothetical protein